jgi:hypothetical protein
MRELHREHGVAELIAWRTSRGHCQALLQAAANPGPRLFIASLRDWPDTDTAGDIEQVAAAAWTAAERAGLVDHSDSAAARWYLRHGPYSSYDPTGPETITEVELACTDGLWRPVRGWDSFTLLDRPTAARALAGVPAVEEALAALEGAH